MHAHITGYVPGAILMAGLACVSCSDSTPADATGPTAVGTITFSVQPERVAPEFLPASDSCIGARAFRTRFVIVAGGVQGFAVQDLRASFNDPFGLVTVPLLLPPSGPIAGSMMGTSLPLPLPSSMPVPIPSGGVNNGLTVTGSREVPVTLEFGCHVRPRGTIVLVVGTRDERGRSATHQLTVDVGE